MSPITRIEWEHCPKCGPGPVEFNTVIIEPGVYADGEIMSKVRLVPVACLKCHRELSHKVTDITEDG